MTVVAFLFPFLILVAVAMMIYAFKIRRSYHDAGYQFVYELCILMVIWAIVIGISTIGLLNEFLRWTQDGSVAFFGSAIIAMSGLIAEQLLESRGVKRLQKLEQQSK